MKNSFELVEKLKRLHITDEYKLISLESLFTNVPMEIAVDYVNEQWVFIFGLPSPERGVIGSNKVPS